jgi:hypothetical protein
VELSAQAAGAARAGAGAHAHFGYRPPSRRRLKRSARSADTPFRLRPTRKTPSWRFERIASLAPGVSATSPADAPPRSRYWPWRKTAAASRARGAGDDRDCRVRCGQSAPRVQRPQARAITLAIGTAVGDWPYLPRCHAARREGLRSRGERARDEAHFGPCLAKLRARVECADGYGGQVLALLERGAPGDLVNRRVQGFARLGRTPGRRPSSRAQGRMATMSYGRRPNRCAGRRRRFHASSDRADREAPQDPSERRASRQTVPALRPSRMPPAQAVESRAEVAIRGSSIGESGEGRSRRRRWGSPRAAR